MTHSFRTHYCSELKITDKGKKVRLSGWIHSIRDHGGVLFLTLRDQHGITQIVSDETKNIDAFRIMQTLHVEYVVSVKGEVLARTKENINEKIATGEIEVFAEKITVLSTAKTMPFPIDQDSLVKDEALRYRYLHLRRPSVAKNIVLRSKITKLIRDFLYDQGFHEVETPFLTKATPEGARDFLVPSRVFPGEFYALPQSPQQYKQLLMVGGFDKYFQIARALRDEDSRADRQPEHTQIDMEMSFVERDEIIDLLEKMFCTVIEKFFPEKKLLSSPFSRLDYYECLNLYGTDKPDLRFDLRFFDVKSIFNTTEFKIFQQKGHIKAIKVENVAHQITRKEINTLITIAQECSLAGIITIVHGEEGYKSSAGKAINDKEILSIIKAVSATKQDLVLLASGEGDEFINALSVFRARLGEHYDLIDQNMLGFAFVVDFPLFQWDSKEKRLDPTHHMFVLPKEDSMDLLEKEPEKVISTQFDVVCNGYEICSGSRRIHSSTLQRKIMKMIGLSDQEIDEKFAHILQAFDFGAPPHGGAAPGLDRLLMVLTNTKNIRDVIAFPKTQRGQDLMMQSPNAASKSQLKELCLSIDYTEMKEERVQYLKQQERPQ